MDRLIEHTLLLVFCLMLVAIVSIEGCAFNVIMESEKETLETSENPENPEHTLKKKLLKTLNIH